MYVKVLLNLILVMVIVVFQLSFISGLPGWLNNLNFVLVILIFILTFSDLKIVLWWSIGVGWLCDIYSFLPFGFYLVSLFLTMLIANFLLTNFFTNRSLYSFLALTFFSTLFYEFFLFLMIYVWQLFVDPILFFAFTKEFWLKITEQAILNLLFVFILYYIISFVSHKLKPVFLLRGLSSSQADRK